jgi:leucyl-tRNA synthetase
VCGLGGVLSEQAWAAYDETLCVDANVEIVVQICGKVKAKAMVGAGCGKDVMLETAKAALGTQLDGKTIIKEIVVPDKLVNFVAK